MMSFTQNLKAQLSQIKNECDFCDIAELSAIIRLCTSYRDGEIIIATENTDVADRITLLFGKVFSRSADFTNQNGLLKYKPDIDFFTDEIAQRLKLFSIDESEVTPLECCRGAFLRGAFLGGGSMTNPKTQYHMEFDAKHEGYARQICSVFEELGISSRVTCRKNRYITYIKEYSAIADALGAMGAVSTAMDIYNISIEKEIRNTANRQANCEIANIEKITKTASLQIEAIKKLKNTMAFSELPSTLREIADLRCAHPDESLKELGDRLNPPIGKSGVNHRLKRIMEIAQKL